MMQWHFRAVQPNEKERNPVPGEFFSEQAIAQPSQALVRETIQNSLDAHSEEEVVTVRFYVSGERSAISPARATFWFGDAWPHLTAPKNGLSSVPAKNEPCPFLVVEDFGTTGLEGDTSQYQSPADDRENRFFAFFRAEGVSLKSGQQGGRWGIGKTVFPRSSRISSLIGLTVRSDDQRTLILGTSTLFCHDCNGTRYAPDGFMGNLADQGKVLPIDDPQTIKALQNDFLLARSDAPGLSIVVPYFDPKITVKDLTRAVVNEYFYPILLGRLEVRIHGADEGQPVNLTAETLVGFLANTGPDPALKAVVDLALWAREEGKEQCVLLGKPSTPPQWTSEVLPEREASDLADRFARNERLSLRVPLRIHQHAQPNRDSYFDVYLQRPTDEAGYKPVFIRNGIIIPKVWERQVRGHRLLAVVVIEDEPLANLLGDAEPPAHTHWTDETHHFKKAAYSDGKAVIEFVSNAPRMLAELLTKKLDERDVYLLARFFPRQEENGIDTEDKPKNKDDTGTTPKPSIPLPPSNLSPFRVDQANGGFRVVRGDQKAKRPQFCRISVAYDTNRGGALKKYNPADFRFQELKIGLISGKQRFLSDNVLVVEIDDDSFDASIAGFDPNRDLYIDVKGLEHWDEA